MKNCVVVGGGLCGLFSAKYGGDFRYEVNQIPFPLFETITIFTLPLTILAFLANITALRRLHHSKKELFKKMEQVRLKAGELMGMGDCSKSVTPKFGLVAKAQHEHGSMATRYFMPWATHPTLAVTGSQCLAACASVSGSVADDLIDMGDQLQNTLTLEHPLGSMDVVLQRKRQGGVLAPCSAGVVRTARKLAQGDVFVPQAVWRS